MASAAQSELMELPSSVPAVMSKAGFAQYMGNTNASVTQWIGRGMPCRQDGRIDVAESEAWVKANIRPKSRSTDKTELNAIRTDLEAEKLRKVRLEADVLEAKLVDRATVARVIAARARMERDRHLTWVQRMAPSLAAELGCNPGDLFRLLDKEMRAHLQDVADTALPSELSDET